MTNVIGILARPLIGGRKLETRQVMAHGQQQAATLPRLFWLILEEIAEWEGLTLPVLIHQIASAQPTMPLAEALEAFAITYCRRKARISEA